MHIKAIDTVIQLILIGNHFHRLGFSPFALYATAIKNKHIGLLLASLSKTFVASTIARFHIKKKDT